MITTQAIHLGPIMLPWSIMILVLAILISILVCKFSRSYFKVSAAQWTVFNDSIWTAILIGLSAGRIGFVALNFSIYLEHPLDIIKIQDKGFQIYCALFAALAWIYWKNRALTKKFLILAMTIFLVVFVAGRFIHQQIQMQYQQFPEAHLLNLEQKNVELTQFLGKPVVINLWASWCPPCRREMPILSEAQQKYPNVQFIFINQNEDAKTVQTYLLTHQVDLHNVLLDANGTVAQKTGMYGLPSTLFFDAQGQLVDSHMGEISHAMLQQQIQKLTSK